MPECRKGGQEPVPLPAKRKGGIPFSQQMLKFRQRFFSSSVVERSAVNRLVVGSNPTWGDFIILVPSGAFMSTPDAGKGMLNNQ